MIFTIASLLFIAFTWSRAILRYRDGSLTIGGFVLWSLIWASATIVVVWPGLTFNLAHQLGIGRGADAIVYTSIGLLFYLIFRLYIKISTIDQEMTRMIRAMALKKES